MICLSACAPPGGGRNEISPRLLRHFNMIWLCNLSQESMFTIFSKILGGYIQHNLPQYEGLTDKLVQSSINIYTRIQKELLPTPTRSHYTFNLRDLSKVFQGMLMVKAKYLTSSSDALVRLWCHESSRVFRDRLINDDDRVWFNNAILDQLQTTLGNVGKSWKQEQFVDVIYGDFLTRMLSALSLCIVFCPTFCSACFAGFIASLYLSLPCVLSCHRWFW
jgi:dynein heavy chain